MDPSAAELAGELPTIGRMDPSAAPPPPPPPQTVPPPPPPQAASARRPTSPQVGQLTLGWRIATGAVWAMAFVGFVAVWKTSRELGLSTWWLGPPGDPAPALVSLLPFVPAAAMILLAVNNWRWLPWAGFVAAAVTALVGMIDLGTVPRLGIVELAIAGAGALTAVAGFAGRYGR